MTSFARPGSDSLTSSIWNKNKFSPNERRNFNRRVSSPYSKSWCSSATDLDDNLSKASRMSQKRKRTTRSDSSCSNYSVLTEDNNNVIDSKLDRCHDRDSSNVNRYCDLYLDRQDEDSDDRRGVLRRRLASHADFRDSPSFSLPSFESSNASSSSYAPSHNVISSHAPGRNLMSKSHVVVTSSNSTSSSRNKSSNPDVSSSYRGLSHLRLTSNSCSTTVDHDDDEKDDNKRSSFHSKSFTSSSGSGKTSTSGGSATSGPSNRQHQSGMDSYCSLSSLDSLGSPSSPHYTTTTSSSAVAVAAVVPVTYDDDDMYGRERKFKTTAASDYDRYQNKKNKSSDNRHHRRRSRSTSRSYYSSAASRYSNDKYKSTSGKGYTQSYVDLPLEWWERCEGCKEAKLDHMDRVDNVCSSREELVLRTTLWRDDIVLEPNMFPYDCPYGVEHYTLWSVYDLSHREIQRYVDSWLSRHYPKVKRWQYDDNNGERSIDLFHVHVFIEMIPFSFEARPDLLYLPPHLAPPCSGPGPSVDKDYEY